LVVLDGVGKETYVPSGKGSMAVNSSIIMKIKNIEGVPTFIQLVIRGGI
jgi:hypothetical protein